LVKKCDKIKVKRGPTESNKPATFDCTYFSDQLIKEKGIKFPIMPIKMISRKFFLEILNEYFFKLKIINKKKAPKISLSEATENGLTVSTDIFIAIKADPQIALNNTKSNRLLEKILFFR